MQPLALMLLYMDVSELSSIFFWAKIQPYRTGCAFHTLKIKR